MTQRHYNPRKLKPPMQPQTYLIASFDDDPDAILITAERFHPRHCLKPCPVCTRSHTTSNANLADLLKAIFAGGLLHG